MERRQLLASLGTGAAALAGCAGLLGGESTPTLTPVDAPPATTTPSPVSTEPEPCVESGGESRYVPVPFDEVPPPTPAFQSLECPHSRWEREVICYHTADLNAATPLLVGGRRATVSEPQGAVVDFVLLNRGSEAVRIRPAAWSLLRRRDRRWVETVGGTAGCVQLVESGDVYWWRIAVGRRVRNPWTNVTTIETTLSDSVYLFAIPVQSADGRERMYVAPFEISRGSAVRTATATES
jgi:hypothetical protein